MHEGETLLQSEDLILRRWRYEDIHSLVKYANNIEIARFLTDMFPHPYTHEDGMRFIKMASTAHPLNIFCIAIEGEAAGSIGFHFQSDIFRKNAELGYWLALPFHGKGYMTRAVQLMIDYSFNTFDITRIFARPFGINKASARVLEKAGFSFEAKLNQTIFKYGEYYDELIFSIRRPGTGSL